MEHFLNQTDDDHDDHHSSFFQPPKHDDEAEINADEQSPVKSSTETGKKDVEPKELSRRANLTFDEEANIKLQVLVSNFSDEQLDRYEKYRRSAFSKVSIKRLMHTTTGTVPSSNVVIAMAGIAKVFVGEIVEEALEMQRREKKNSEAKSTPLEPKHLREAYRRINSRSNHLQRKTWKGKRKSRF